MPLFSINLIYYYTITEMEFFKYFKFFNIKYIPLDKTEKILYYCISTVIQFALSVNTYFQNNL